MSRAPWKLAVDIEGSGETPGCSVLGFGAVCYRPGPDGKLYDSLKMCGYIPGATVFEPRCVKEFWSKHPERLQELVYTGPDTHEQRQAAMIRGFHAFRERCEAAAHAEGRELVLVTDNGVYDLGKLNVMMAAYLTPDTLPMPWGALPVLTAPRGAPSDVPPKAQQRWGAYVETGSALRGVLAATPRSRILSARAILGDKCTRGRLVEHIYSLPPGDAVHNHDPLSDAHKIMQDYHVVLRVAAHFEAL